MIKSLHFFDLAHFQRLGQKSKNNFVHFLVQMRTRKFAFEIYLPLGKIYIQIDPLKCQNSHACNDSSNIFIRQGIHIQIQKNCSLFVQKYKKRRIEWASVLAMIYASLKANCFLLVGVEICSIKRQGTQWVEKNSDILSTFHLCFQKIYAHELFMLQDRTC